MMKRVMVFGTFDIIHPGHIHFFKQAKKYGDELIVVVARDKTVEAIKGRLPQNTQEQRQKNLLEIPEVNNAVLGNPGDKHAVIEQYQPDVICLGYDQKAFIDGLAKKFPNITVMRLVPHKPEIYKSSKMKS